MADFVDLTGQRFTRWLVLKRVPNMTGRSAWLCVCDCGVERPVIGLGLVHGKSRSCGCLAKEETRDRNLTRLYVSDPRRKSRSYGIWIGMRARCRDPNNTKWQHYGGRGITVCDRWLSFENFYADMGEAPPNHTIERKDNDLGYSPANCVWATQQTQLRNTRRNKRVTLCGERLSLLTVCDRYQIKPHLVRGYKVRHRVTDTEAIFYVLDRKLSEGCVNG